jgi:hypothetical protein
MQIEVNIEELELLRDGLRTRESELMEDVKTGKWSDIPQCLYNPKEAFFENRRLRAKLTDYYTESVHTRAFHEFGVKARLGFGKEPRCNMCGFRLPEEDRKGELCSRCDKVNNYP